MHLLFTMDYLKVKNLEMETEDHYKQKAAWYRSTPEYGKMISLYPVLESTIKDCQGEHLVA